MEPLRIDFFFRDLVSVSDQPLHLDGLLAWASVERARRDGKTDLTAAAEDLPLARRGERGGPKVWCASALEFSFLTPPSPQMLTRTTDVQDYAEAVSSGRIALSRPRDQLPVASGPLRNYLVSYSVRQADRATGWCVGDAEGVRALLGEIRHVGKYGRMGYGAVTSIATTPDPAAKAAWKRRQLPWREDGYVACLGNFKPPYWDRTTMTEVYAPPPEPLDMEVA